MNEKEMHFGQLIREKVTGATSALDRFSKRFVSSMTRVPVIHALEGVILTELAFVFLNPSTAEIARVQVASPQGIVLGVIGATIMIGAEVINYTPSNPRVI